MTPNQRLSTATSLTAISLLVCTAIGCRATDENPKLDGTHHRLREIFAVVYCLHNEGYDFHKIKSVSDLLREGLGRKCADALYGSNPKAFTTDLWGDDFEWGLVPGHEGVTIFVCSKGAPSRTGEPSRKEPFVRIRISKDSEPVATYYDAE